MPAVEALINKVDVTAVRPFLEVKKGYTPFRTGDVIFAKITPCMENGKIAVVPDLDNDLALGSTEFHVIRPLSDLLPLWFFYFLSARTYRSEAEHNMTGAVGQRRVPIDFIAQSPIPFPPLAEQKRIVAKIEELFSELDAGEASLRQARRQLGVYRQSLLKQAFEGKLTETWRTQNPRLESATELFGRIQTGRVANWKGKGKYKDPVVPNEEFEATLPTSWILASMDALTTHITSGSRDWTKYYRDDGYAVFVMAQNVRPLNFDPTPVTRVSPPEFDRDKSRSAVARDDLLVTIVGANTGDVCRVDHEFEDYYVCQSVALLRPGEPATAKYLELYMNSKEHGQKQFDQWMYGQGRPHLSFDQLRSTAVCLAPIPEQQEIVRLLDAQFEVIEQNEREITAALKRSEALRQSILKKAFSGQLVPQDPTDEPASELLARIRAERKKSTTTHSRRGRVRKVRKAV